MASGWFTNAKNKLAKADADFDTLDVRGKLMMSNFVFATDQDATNITGLSTSDIFDGSGYVDKDLGTVTVTKDDPNNRSEISVPNVTYTALGAGTRNCIGMVVYAYVDGTGANDWPIAWVEWSSPWNGNGGDVTVQWNAEGMLQIT